MTGIQNKVRVLFEKVNGERFRVVNTDEVIFYFMNGKEVFPFLELGGVLCNFGIEFFWNAVKRKAVVGRKDKLLFQPETFLEFFDVREKFDDLGGNTMDEFRGFQPCITIG